MKDLIVSLAPIIVISLGIFATTTFILLRTAIGTGAKFMLVPTFLVGSIIAPWMLGMLLGFSVSLPLPDKFLVLQHRTVVVDSKKKSIEVWLKEPKSPTRLYVIPWTKQMEEILEKASKGRETGHEALLNREGTGKNKPKGDSDMPFGLELQSREKQFPKSAPEQKPEQKPKEPAEPQSWI